MDNVSFVIDTTGDDSLHFAQEDKHHNVQKCSRVINLRNRSIVQYQDALDKVNESDSETEEVQKTSDSVIVDKESDSDSDDEFTEASKVNIAGCIYPGGVGRIKNTLCSQQQTFTNSDDLNNSYINLTAYKETTNFGKKSKAKEAASQHGSESDKKRTAAVFTRKAMNTDVLLKQKSVISKPGYLAKPDPPAYDLAERELKRRRKAQREKNKGSSWYNLPAQELTDEKKNDLLLIKWRDSLDPKRFYKRSDMKGLPKYFQMGTVIADPTEYYSARVPKKERKATIVDELLADANFKHKVKKRHLEIMEKRKGRAGHKAYRHMKRLKKRKK